MKYTAIILAAGNGSRTGLEMNKILQKIHDKSVINYSIEFFANDDECNQIILVVNSKDFALLSNQKISKNFVVVLGGKTRQESVYNSLQYVREQFVLVHDAARPFIPKKGVEQLKHKLLDYSSLTLGVKVTDTIQKIQNSYVFETLNRDSLIATQTPQAFHLDKLVKAHELALKNGFEATDDTTLLLELLDIPALFIEGDTRNIKFTKIEDLKLLEVIL